MLNRRRFLGRSGLAAAVGVGWPDIARSAESVSPRGERRPRHIIHVVSDGMSMGTLTCADLYSRKYRQRPLAWMTLYDRPGVQYGFMNMRSLNSLVTDSAAASSSWGSGSRVCNGSLNVLPDGKFLTPLYTLFADAGWWRGLVTTTEITHATPAGFAANARARDRARVIAAQYLERKVEVLLGGGRRHFVPASKKDINELKPAFAAAGYPVVESLHQLHNAPVGRYLLGLFADKHLPFSLDRNADPRLSARIPTLAQLTKAALDRLRAADHFILQVEGGRVDHAAHNSDAASAIHEQIGLDGALEVCLEFQRNNPDTLIVVTTDHGNSNLGLNGVGAGYGQSTPQFAHLTSVRASYGEILAKIKRRGHKVPLDPPAEPGKTTTDTNQVAEADGAEDEDEAANDWWMDESGSEDDPSAIKKVRYGVQVAAKDIQEVIERYTGYHAPLAKAETLAEFILGKGRSLYDSMSPETTQLGQLMANHLGIGWTGNAHTADYVPILALGPGAERFTGFIQNTRIFEHYTELAGITFKNPTAPEHASIGGPVRDLEDVADYARPFHDSLV